MVLRWDAEPQAITAPRGASGLQHVCSGSSSPRSHLQTNGKPGRFVDVRSLNNFINGVVLSLARRELQIRFAQVLTSNYAISGAAVLLLLDCAMIFAALLRMRLACHRSNDECHTD